jgi:predicted dehydrogenase
VNGNFSGEVLLLGYGSLARRRILPALRGVEAVRTVHIASVSLSTQPAAAHECRQESKIGSILPDYRVGLAQLVPHSLVYISLPNALHATWARAALGAGHHVVIDKPAVLDAAQARELTVLAHQHGVCCAEAHAWIHHPLADTVREASRELDVTSVQAVFLNPPLAKDNFRYTRTLGGGVILDRASYAITCGELVFGEHPCFYESRILGRYGDGVECSALFTLGYSRGRVLTCLVGWDAEYTNQLELYGATGKISVQRIFTPPPELVGQVRVVAGGVERSVEVLAADSFQRMLESLCADLVRGSYQQWIRELSECARGVEQLQRERVPAAG